MTVEEKNNLLDSIRGQRLSPPDFDDIIEVLREPRSQLHYVAMSMPGSRCVNMHCGYLDWTAPKAPAWIDRRDLEYCRAQFPEVIYQR